MHVYSYMQFKELATECTHACSVNLIAIDVVSDVELANSCIASYNWE